MEAPIELFNARDNVCASAQVLCLLLWRDAVSDVDGVRVRIRKLHLRGVLGSPRGSLDRHIRELRNAGLVWYEGDLVEGETVELRVPPRPTLRTSYANQQAGWDPLEAQPDVR